jgi:hypothetical protein
MQNRFDLYERAMLPYQDLLRQSLQEQKLRSVFVTRSLPALHIRLMLVLGSLMINAGKRICAAAGSPASRKPTYSQYPIRRQI